MITKDYIDIKKNLGTVYKTASDIKNQHTYIPGYKPSIVHKTDDNKLLIERTAELNGKTMKWKSLAVLNKNKSIEFEQLEGRLKGMKITWLFNKFDDFTRVTIIHDFHLNIPVFSYLLERFIAKPKIDKITKNVLIGLKNKLENN